MYAVAFSLSGLAAICILAVGAVCPNNVICFLPFRVIHQTGVMEAAEACEIRRNGFLPAISSPGGQPQSSAGRGRSHEEQPCECVAAVSGVSGRVSEATWAAGEERRCSRQGLWKGVFQSRKAVVWPWPRPHSPEDPAGGGKGASAGRCCHGNPGASGSAGTGGLALAKQQRETRRRLGRQAVALAKAEAVVGRAV